MAFLKVAEARSLSGKDRAARLEELRKELMHERGVAAMGGSPPSPGKIRQIRRQIARLLTIEREDQLIKQGRLMARVPAKKSPSMPAGAAGAGAKKPKE